MKTMFGCSLAAVMGTMLMLGLCTQGMWVRGPGYSKTNPRLELPTLDNKSHSHREAVIHVSLNRSREWIFEEGKVDDIDLERTLAEQVSRYEAIGYRSSIRVRIAGHEPARHFHQLHKAATSAGINDFLIAYFQAEAP
jgi:biopolymer transport protein ExbD